MLVQEHLQLRHQPPQRRSIASARHCLLQRARGGGIRRGCLHIERALAVHEPVIVRSGRQVHPCSAQMSPNRRFQLRQLGARDVTGPMQDDGCQAIQTGDEMHRLQM
jgi:hypothetical protein